MDPPLRVSRQKMYAMFTAINVNGVDRNIKQTDFVDFFTNLYQRRLHLLENMEQSESKECEQLIELIASESNQSPTRKAALVEEKKQLDVLLSHMNIMLRRVRLVVKAGNEFLQHPLSKAGLGEMTTEEARVPGEEASQRIGRINAMLSNRIYKRNQILPLAHQRLGQTYAYGSEGDSLQHMVEQGKCWLEKDLFDNIPHTEHVPSDSSGINKALPGPFANVVRNVGLSEESVRRASQGPRR
eukprot:FR736541.1.p1 GENE.FR736541.1~~FR736541.1.p1  ORF type:complete len:274 (+),score=17.49 FR736541.1:99-824(+)